MWLEPHAQPADQAWMGGWNQMRWLAQAFVSRTRLAVQRADDLAPAAFEDDGPSADASSSAAAGAAGAAAPAGPAAGGPAPGGVAPGGRAAVPGADLLGDLLDMDTPAAAPAPAYLSNGMPTPANASHSGDQSPCDMRPCARDFIRPLSRLSCRDF